MKKVILSAFIAAAFAFSMTACNCNKAEEAACTSEEKTEACAHEHAACEGHKADSCAHACQAIEGQACQHQGDGKCSKENGGECKHEGECKNGEGCKHEGEKAACDGQHKCEGNHEACPNKK